MFTEIQKQEAEKLQSNKIELTPELFEIFNNIKRDSKFSSRELIGIYSGLPKYQEMIKKIQPQTIQLEKQVKQIRLNNSQLTDEVFFEKILLNHSKTIIEAIEKDYKEKLTPEIIKRLNNFSINVINKYDEHGDMTANSDTSQIIINMAHFANDRSDVEGKIVRAMATMPHEIFHFVYRMLKDKNSCDERMVYNLKNGEKATCFGMVGHMLNEGFVEKLSTDFCKKNNIYSSINPSYIQFTELCDHIMRNNQNINEQFLIHNNYEGVLATFSKEAREKYKETERYEYLGNFELEIQNGKKRIIDEQEVISSFNEKVEPTIQLSNDSFSETLQNETKQNIDKRSLDKPKVKTLKKNINNSSSPSSGFIDILILTLIIGFVAGTIFMIIYGIYK